MNKVELNKLEKDYESVLKGVNSFKQYNKIVPNKFQKNFIQSIAAVHDAMDILEDTIADIKIEIE